MQKQMDRLVQHARGLRESDGRVKAPVSWRGMEGERERAESTPRVHRLARAHPGICLS